MLLSCWSFWLFRFSLSSLRFVSWVAMVDRIATLFASYNTLGTRDLPLVEGMMVLVYIEVLEGLGGLEGEMSTRGVSAEL